MNPNYKHTITIYNCLKGEDSATKKDVWYRTVLRNCFYKNVVGQTENGDSLKMSNAYTVRIPVSDKYLTYREWSQKSEGERSEYFTCQLGDIIVKGECPDMIAGKAPDTAAQVLQRNKPEAFLVTAFSDNTNSLYGKHYRAGG